jgi:membrane protease YdiL (CAAX protease family)
LEIFNIDKFSIAILPLLGIARVKLHIPYEEYYRMVCNLFGLILFVYCFLNWRKLPKTKPNWVMLGMLSSIIIFPLAFVESIQIEKYIDSNGMYAINPIVYGLRSFFYTLTFVAPFEEIITRGVLWGQLRKWNIGENKIFWLQGILFWLVHGWQIFTPISFFITLPIITLIFSLLVRNSKQLFSSIVSHTLIDTLGPMFVSIIARK